MYIILLGGENNEDGKLKDFMLKRIEKFLEIYDKYKNNNPKIILSGGQRFSIVPHCYYVKEELTRQGLNIKMDHIFDKNNSTVDEAINMSNYFEKLNYKGNVKIITSNWHMDRVKYLFDITFSKLVNIKLEYIECINGYDDNMLEIVKEERNKIKNMELTPYGKWEKYINKNINI